MIDFFELVISAQINDLALTTTFLCQARTNSGQFNKSGHPSFPKPFAENLKQKYPFPLDRPLRFILKLNLLIEEA
jgi:hypothetical protein